jgi:hypothetical protein
MISEGGGGKAAVNAPQSKRFAWFQGAGNREAFGLRWL